MKVVVIIPTITGREDHLERCIEAYTRTSPQARLVVVKDKPTCGIAWQEGATANSNFDYLHLTADDLVPEPGWLEAAIAIADAGNIPAPVQVTPDGNVVGHYGSNGNMAPMTVIPFCTKAQWEQIQPMAPWHYWTDNYFSERAKRAGAQIIYSDAYKFIHHFAQVGRGAGMSEPVRMSTDGEAFNKWERTGEL